MGSDDRIPALWGVGRSIIEIGRTSIRTVEILFKNYKHKA